ncbi:MULTISPECIES: hypothetical protein [unclassified Acinetobacter]|uniref:hypothetical protein n=1 Tax=unclassified Acinetobacter TaxID=196816 RepID=UPI0025781ECD|nr:MULTISPECIES: hypothetical protein [unclassified Acinetobacter]MDM1765710.1 hypothetical protein [Acinetobacter sp. 226-1]MDM1769403.1 hypothetical protein [Acinetobacter sp. 226-4]
MSVIIKSDKIATASLGNINGIKGAKDWSIFLDFENEVYSTKSNDVIKKDYLLSDVVEASRQNLNGAPISINKSGIERAITSTTEVRTALLKNGRFGLLSEDENDNFFLNSSAPATQTVTLPAAASRIAVSCEGAGSLTVNGDISEKGTIVTKDKPYLFTRTSTSAACNLNITVNGSLTHAQVEVAVGEHTASSKIKTGGAIVKRPREYVKVKQSLFDSIIANKNGFTILAQTLAYNPTINSANSYASQLVLEGGTAFKLMKQCGLSNQQYMGYLKNFIDSTATNNSAVFKGTFSAENRFHAHTFALAFGEGKALGAYSGMSEAQLVVSDPLNITNIMFGTGYASPIGQNGLRGIITKLVVYDRVLSQEEITELSKSWG